ncbi:hypothetical protein ACEZCY_35700 [Streptacidiphilus sp. N1-12]|uniref:Uncharacterized protein n=1 Tax=Streptacidiphilus alkalitolerans TaxID=3342712 RepID=A0ABV6WR62_9ACTN
MAWLAPVLWGLFGGFAMDGLDFVNCVRQHHRLPWVDAHGNSEPGPLAYGTAVGLRVAIGAGLAGAADSSWAGGITAWAAVGLGAAAPTVLEKITTWIPLTARAGLGALAGQLQATAAPAAPTQPSAPHSPHGESAERHAAPAVGPSHLSAPEPEGT